MVKKGSPKKAIVRIVDANLNRCREALRVCEDVARFVLDDERLTRRFKNMRHRITRISEGCGFDVAHLCRVRDAAGDVGKGTSLRERKRAGLKELFLANSARAEESVRVLEECFKVLDGKVSEKFKAVRYEVYAVEKVVVERLSTLRHFG